jgi:hypothetical protein
MCRQSLRNEVPEAGNPLYLALHLHFADTPPIHATTPIQARQTTKRKSDRELITKCNTSAIEEHPEHKAHDSDAS